MTYVTVQQGIVLAILEGKVLVASPFSPSFRLLIYETVFFFSNNLVTAKTVIDLYFKKIGFREKDLEKESCRRGTPRR